MKKVIALSIIFITLTTFSVFADSLSTTSDSNFENGVEKILRIAMPENCSAFNGTLVVQNAELVSLAEEFNNKILESFENNFVLYELNNGVMAGDNLVIKVNPLNDNEITIGIIDAAGSTPIATPIEIGDFGITIRSGYDYNQDGLFDNADIVYVVGQLLRKIGFDIVTLQRVINRLIAL